ncbi:MAG: hypothetical protein HY918_04205 [Candidatus Doudnabacteria bacterium]|nr:hypothetical protein [Candidatus Doudnabacteria bacterium]
MENLEQLKSAVLNKQKTLAAIYHNSGGLTLADYVLSWRLSKKEPEANFAKIIKFLLADIYGQDEAEKISGQIQKFPLVSTIDHHGIFGHPFFLNANLLFSLRNDLKFLPVLTTSGVSLNNSSWPACLVLSDKFGKQIRLSFFHDGHKTKTAFAAQKIEKRDVENIRKQIKGLKFLDGLKQKKLDELVKKVFLSPEVLERKIFSDQACIISRMLWAEVFPEAPKLAYLPLEDLVGELIVKDIANNKNHFLCQLLFTSSGFDLAEKYFTGLKGAFGFGKGSFLFWEVDGFGRRRALSRQDLETKYRDLAEGISNDLKDRKIYPTSLVCFLVSLFYGLNCLGGFNQTSWLTDIKEKFVALLSERGETELAARISQVVTDNFAETPVAFSLANNVLLKPSLLDLYLNNASYSSIINNARKITLAQSLETELPEIYKIVMPELDRLPELSAITSGQIAQNNGLTKKLDLI